MNIVHVCVFVWQEVEGDDERRMIEEGAGNVVYGQVIGGLKARQKSLDLIMGKTESH